MSLKSAHTAKIGKAFINARKLRSMSQEEAASTALININFIKAIITQLYFIPIATRKNRVSRIIFRLNIDLLIS